MMPFSSGCVNPKIASLLRKRGSHCVDTQQSPIDVVIRESSSLLICPFSWRHSEGSKCTDAAYELNGTSMSECLPSSRTVPSSLAQVFDPSPMSPAEWTD